MSDTNDLSEKRSEPKVRGTVLVTVSTALALLLQANPCFESDTAAKFVAHRGIFGLLAVKAVFLTIILTPLVIYTMLNGLRAIKHVKGRVVAITIIIVLNTVFWICLILHDIVNGR
jgi:hypothetical protein